MIFNGVNLEDFVAKAKNLEVSPGAAGKSSEPRTLNLEENASRQAYPAGHSQSEAPPDAANYQMLNADSSTGNGRPYIFALGRMARQKGFDVLLRAYALVAAAAAKHSASGIEHLEEKGSAALPSRRAGTRCPLNTSPSKQHKRRAGSPA